MTCSWTLFQNPTTHVNMDMLIRDLLQYGVPGRSDGRPCPYGGRNTTHMNAGHWYERPVTEPGVDVLHVTMSDRESPITFTTQTMAIPCLALWRPLLTWMSRSQYRTPLLQVVGVSKDYVSLCV
jgi:hypothetical protein